MMVMGIKQYTFHIGVALSVQCFQVELEFGMLVFVEGEKLEDLEKNALNWNQTGATVWGGECFHHCIIPAPLFST